MTFKIGSSPARPRRNLVLRSDIGYSGVILSDCIARSSGHFYSTGTQDSCLGEYNIIEGDLAMSSHQMFYTHHHGVTCLQTPTTPRIMVICLVLHKSVGLRGAVKLLRSDRYGGEFVPFPNAMAYYEIVKNGQLA